MRLGISSLGVARQRRLKAAAPTAFRYWRLLVTANDGDPTYVSASVINLYAGGTNVSYPARATAQDNTVLDWEGASYAFNGALGDEWLGRTSELPVWASIDLGAEYQIDRYEIASQRSVTGRTPSAWKLQGSNVSQSGPWTDVHERSGETGWGVQRTRAFSVPGDDKFISRMALDFNGTDGSTAIVDSSPYARTMTAAGSAVLSSQNSFDGSTSLKLTITPGNPSFVWTPFTDDFNFGQDNFRVSARVRFDDITDMGLLSSLDNGGFDFAFVGGQIRLGRINTAWDSSFTFVRTPGVWYEVEVARKDDMLTCKVNGNLIGSVANNISYSAGSQVRVGISSGDRHFGGNIDRLRVIKG